MSRPRKSLRDLDREAFAAPAPATPNPAAPTEPSAVLATPPATPTPTSSTPPGSLTKPSVGVYIQASTFDDAKSAYLYDFDHRAGPETLSRWVEAALVAHLGRGPAGRVEVAAQLGDEPKTRSRGVQRRFEISAETLADIDAALVADRQVTRVMSVSQLVVEAIRAATAVARQEAGGTLPPAPARLPNRLRR